MADIAIRFRDLTALNREQKLFPHFGEAGTTVFAVEKSNMAGMIEPRRFDECRKLDWRSFQGVFVLAKKRLRQ